MHNRTTLVGAIVALIALAVAAVLGADRFGADPTSIGLVLTGLAGPTIVAFLALLKADQTESKVDQVHHRVNGDLDRRLAEAFRVAMHGNVPTSEDIGAAGSALGQDVPPPPAEDGGA